MSTGTMERRPAVPALAEKFAELEQIVMDCELAQLENHGKFAKAFSLAKGIRQLRQMITPTMMDEIMPLMNTALGFKTDKDPNRPVWNSETRKKESPEPYSMEVVRECLIEAVLRGANPVGNEFNIISSQAYMTRQFYQRAIGQIEGVTNVKWQPGAVLMKEDGEAKVSCYLSWTRDGKPEFVDRTGRTPETASLQVRINKFMGMDAAIGKAQRKVFKLAYEQITGSEAAPDGEVDDSNMVTVQPTKAEDKAADFDAKFGGPNADAEAERVLADAAARANKPKAEPPANADAELPAGNEAIENGDEGTTEDPCATWEGFHTAMEAIAKERGMDPEAFDKAMGSALMMVGKKGKGSTTTVDWRSKQLAAFRAGNWNNGRIEAAK